MPEGWLGGVMFLALLVLLFLGVPVAFALGGVALLFAAIGVEAGLFDWHLLLALPERIYGTMANTILLAVPYFIFMGAVLEKSRLAEDLLETIGQLFGPLRGGLAYAVVLVGTLLAAATGVVGASVTAMGLISLPVMLRYGYDPRLAAGVIAASGTLGQIIPPSVVLVVLGDQLGVSVGALFSAALVPGLTLSGLYLLYTALVAWWAPQRAPALPPEARPADLRALLRRVARVLVPPLVLILLVLGSIFVGVATPTEAGALGAVGALGLAWAHRRLTRTALVESLEATARLAIMVMFLLIGSTAFALVFRGVHGDVWVEHFFAQLPGGKWGLLLLTHALVFLLGFFIDFFEICFIVLPILLPAIRALGVDPLWFGVTLGMNLQTSFLTPPFGFALFYLRGVAPPSLPTTAIYRGVVPFIALQLVALTLLFLFPGLAVRL